MLATTNKRYVQAAPKCIFGQLVIGPPGSGKTTYCGAMSKFYNDKLQRKTIVINLDPANDNMPYTAAVDVMELITVEDVMREFSLGPNGALMYCIEYLEKNLDWLLNKMKDFTDNYYVIFDLPGQVELYTHYTCMQKIVQGLADFGFHLCVVHMVDSHYCSEPTKYISTLLLSLSTMLQIGLPHINVLSKADQLFKHSDDMQFSIDYYTEVMDLNYLLEYLDEEPFTARFKKLNAALVGLITDYSLVSFLLLDISKEKYLLSVKNAADKANGYVYGSGEERNIQALLSCAVGVRTQSEQCDFDMQ